jgi:peptidyl-prolyl cis-trans isomerase C
LTELRGRERDRAMINRSRKICALCALLGMAAASGGTVPALRGGAVSIAHAQQQEGPAPVTKTAKPAAKVAGKPIGSAKMVAAPKPPPAPAPLTEADKQRRAQAIVTYQGGEVTVGEIEDAIASQSPFMRERYRDPNNLKELLDKTLRFELLGKEAERAGIDKNDTVRQAVKQNAVQALMKAEFDDKMSAASIPQEDIAKYYQDHIDEYVQPAMQRASHVMVATEAEAKELLPKAKTMDLRAFRQLARDKSMDEASKLRGGDLRYFDHQGKARGETEPSVPPPIVKAAFALKTVGDTAPQPIKIENGYSIVKLTGQRPAISRKLAEVEETIRVRLWRERRQQAIEAFVQTLRAQYKPETHPQLTETIKLEEPDPNRPLDVNLAAEPPAEP